MASSAALKAGEGVGCGTFAPKPYLPRLSGRSTQQRRGVGAAPHDAPPSVKEGVGRFMTGRWGWLWYAWQRRCGRWRRGAGAGGGLGANQLARSCEARSVPLGSGTEAACAAEAGACEAQASRAHIISLHTCVSGHTTQRVGETGRLYTARNDGVVSIETESSYGVSCYPVGFPRGIMNGFSVDTGPLWI